ASEARDHAGGGGLAVVLVVRDQQTDLEPLAAGVEQRRDALPGGELPLLVLAADLLRPAPLLEARAQLAVFRGERLAPAHRQVRNVESGMRSASVRDMFCWRFFDVSDQLRRGRPLTAPLADALFP